MDSPELLRERLKRATPDDQLPGAMIKGVLGRLRDKRGDECADRVKAQLSSKRIFDWFRYPVADMLRVLDAGATELAAEGMGFTDALMFLASGPGDMFADTPVGKTLAMFAGTDPHRGLSVVASTYKATFTFGAASYTRLDERSARLTLTGELLGPAWSIGLIKRGVKNMHHVDLEFELKKLDTLGTEYELVGTW